MTTTTTLPAVEIPGDIPLFPVRKFSVREYHRMIDAGILGEDDNVELIEGWIVPKMPRKPAHDGVIQTGNKRWIKLLPDGWEARIQSAITTTDSEPEPDLAIVREDDGNYMDRHPGSKDIVVVIEVAETSLAQDRGSKLRLYARARIAQYWIANLIDMQVEVYSVPMTKAGRPHYRQRVDYFGGDEIEVVIGNDVVLFPVRDLLP